MTAAVYGFLALCLVLCALVCWLINIRAKETVAHMEVLANARETFGVMLNQNNEAWKLQWDQERKEKIERSNEDRAIRKAMVDAGEREYQQQREAHATQLAMVLNSVSSERQQHATLIRDVMDAFKPRVVAIAPDTLPEALSVDDADAAAVKRMQAKDEPYIPAEED